MAENEEVKQDESETKPAKKTASKSASGAKKSAKKDDMAAVITLLTEIKELLGSGAVRRPMPSGAVRPMLNSTIGDGDNLNAAIDKDAIPDLPRAEAPQEKVDELSENTMTDEEMKRHIISMTLAAIDDVNTDDSPFDEDDTSYEEADDLVKLDPDAPLLDGSDDSLDSISKFKKANDMLGAEAPDLGGIEIPEDLQSPADDSDAENPTTYSGEDADMGKLNK